MSSQSAASTSKEIVTINLSVDLGKIVEAIEASKTLNDNDAIFQGLSEIQAIKSQLGAVQDKIISAEAAVKVAINGKAKALVGKDWQVIRGAGYKITRSMSGAKYEATDDADDKFLKIVMSVNSGEVDDFIKNKGKLPEGVLYNPNRSEQIRITVKPEEK
jgi:hypothetical protein